MIVTGAPECFRSNQLIDRHGLRVSQKVDIWSLGCVFSEAAVWVVLGPDGLEDYRNQRKEATGEIDPPFNGGDCFHNGEKVLDIVLRMHKLVQNRARGCDYITGQVLETMVDEMLWHWSVRPSAEQLRTKSQKIIVKANEQLDEIIAHDSSLSYPNGHPREPVNVPPPPWKATPRPQQNRPATWDVSSSSRPRSEIVRLHQSLSADAPGISDEDEDENLQTAITASGRRQFHVPTQRAEAAKNYVHSLPATDELVDKQQSFKCKGTSDTGNLSKTPSSSQMGRVDGSSTPVSKRNKISDSSSPQQGTRELSFAEALRYKELKKKKKVTAEGGLPFYWLLPRLNERDHVCTTASTKYLSSKLT